MKRYKPYSGESATPNFWKPSYVYPGTPDHIPGSTALRIDFPSSGADPQRGKNARTLLRVGGPGSSRPKVGGFRV